MGIVVDIIIVAVGVLTVVMAYRAGLVKAVMGMLRGVVSFVAAYAFTPILGEMIYDGFMLKSISSGLETTIASLAENSDGSYDLAKMYETMATENDGTLADIARNYNVDMAALEEKCAGVTAGGKDAVSSVSDFIAGPIADSISSVMAFVLIFIGVFVVLTLLTKVVDGIFRLPVLYDVNKIFGVIFGLLEATLLVVFLCNAGAALLIALGSIDGNLFGADVVESTVIMKNIMKIFPSADLFGLIGSIKL